MKNRIQSALLCLALFAAYAALATEAAGAPPRPTAKRPAPTRAPNGPAAVNAAQVSGATSAAGSTGAAIGPDIGDNGGAGSLAKGKAAVTGAGGTTDTPPVRKAKPGAGNGLTKQGAGTLPSRVADGNGDGTVDAADYATWRRTAKMAGDYNNDGVVDAGDYVLWRKGQITVNGQAGSDTAVKH